MQNARVPLGPALVLTCLAGTLWAVTAVASLSVVLGNPTTVRFDGGFVIGSAVPATVATLFAVLFRRVERV